MAQVNFRVDDNIKIQAESICENMGMNMSTALNIFLAKLVNERRIPFEVSVGSNYVSNMTKDEAIQIFMQKMKAAEDSVARGEYVDSEQAHKILGV